MPLRQTMARYREAVTLHSPGSAAFRGATPGTLADEHVGRAQDNGEERPFPSPKLAHRCLDVACRAIPSVQLGVPTVSVSESAALYLDRRLDRLHARARLPSVRREARRRWAVGFNRFAVKKRNGDA